MAYTTINKPSATAFNTVTYSGNASTQSITGVGFQPDLVWVKNRAGASENHGVTDAVRGVTKTFSTNLTNGESTVSDGLTAFGADGFSLGASDQFNGSSGRTYVGWNWKANGAGSANTDGTINTTATSVSTTNGFSISKYTGNSTSGATVGHGLGKVPACVWIKRLDNNDGLVVYHQSMGNTKHMKTDRNNGESTGTAYWNDTSPTSSVVTLGNDTGVNTGTYVMYAWAEIDGYSRFGSYSANNNADGPFIYTGFKPAFLIIKASSISQDWEIFDNKRSTFNPVEKNLAANTSNTNYTDLDIDFLSNGFKIRIADDSVNNSSASYIYMCFAKAPLVGTNNIPCTAR